MTSRLATSLTLAALTALAAPAGAPRADDPAAAPPAQETLRRAREAQGGGAWDRVQGLRLVEAVEMGGLSGKVESVIDVATGRFRDSWQLGPMKGGSGWDGARAWSQDGSGVARVDGAEASRQGVVNDAYRRAQGWWHPERFPAEVRALGERREGERSFQVLAIAPAGGRPFELWVAEDGRFDRWVETEEGRTLTTYLSDWRQVGGVWVPHAQRTTRGEEERQYDQALRLEEATLEAPPPQAAFALPAPPPPDFGFTGGKRQTTVPFTILNGHIYADVTLEGKGPFRLLVDTGGVNIVTPAVARALGLEPEGRLAGGGVGDRSEDIGVVRVKRLQLGDAFVEDQTFYVYGLEAMDPVEGVKEQGLIGYEVFRRFAARIDYQAQRLTLYHPDSFRYRGRGAVIPFLFFEHIPQVEGEIDGLPGRFDLDTGSRASLDLMAPFVERHGLVARYGATAERIGGWGVGGPSREHVVRTGVLKLGPVAIPGVVTGLSTQRKGAFAATEVAGNVGYGVLSRFTVYLDYGHQQVILEKNARFDRRDPYDRAGLWVHLGDGAFEVVEVVPGTPAAEAGLGAGDRIVSVDGRTPRQLTLHQLRSLLKERPAGTRLELRVKRDDGLHVVRLVLRDLV
jgi:hypothetical protein